MLKEVSVFFKKMLDFSDCSVMPTLIFISKCRCESSQACSGQLMVEMD